MVDPVNGGEGADFSVPPAEPVSTGSQGWCSTTEAARRLGVSNAYVQQLLSRGKVTGERVEGARTVWRVDRVDLERFADRREQQRHRKDTGPYNTASAGAATGTPTVAGSDPLRSVGWFDSGTQREADRAAMLELELVAARQELAALQAELGRRELLIERLKTENRDLSGRLSSVARAHVQVVESLIPPAT